MKQNLLLGIIVFFVFLSMAPTLYEWNARGRVHDDRFFELVHNFPTDYNLYLSRIREGKEGAWLATEKYTSESHAPSLSQVLYVVIGRLAHFAHIQTPYVWFAYHVSRVFFGAFLLWVVWKIAEWVVTILLPQDAPPRSIVFWQLMTFLLIATQSTWPKFEVVNAIPRLGGWMPWYTMADSLQRTTFMPHVTFAQGLMVFIFWVFSHSVPQGGTSRDRFVGFITKNLPGNWIFLGIVGLGLGIIFPPGLLFIYGVLGFVTLGEFFAIWWDRGWGGKPITLSVLKQWFVSDLFGRVVFGAVSAPSFIYFAMLLREYPWKRLVEFDVLHPTAFSFVEYFMAVGPLLLFGLLGILIMAALRQQKTFGKLKFFIAWVAAWLAFLFVFSKIPQQSPTRFTQMMPHVPLGILTGYLFYQLYQMCSRICSDRMAHSQMKDLRFKINDKKYWYFLIPKSLIVIPIVIIILGLGTMSSSYMWLRDFVDHKLRATIPLVPTGAQVMYPMYDIIDGLVWLQVYTPRSAIVLSGMTTGNYIPVYSGNTAFVGHANTVMLETKLAAVENFYVRHLPLEEEMAWLKDQRIAYVFYGFEEMAINGGIPDLRSLYPALTLVFENKNVKIYKTP